MAKDFTVQKLEELNLMINEFNSSYPDESITTGFATALINIDSLKETQRERLNATNELKDLCKGENVNE